VDKFVGINEYQLLFFRNPVLIFSKSVVDDAMGIPILVKSEKCIGKILPT